MDLQQQYARFLETHVNAGVTAGLLKSVDVDELSKGKSAEAAAAIQKFSQMTGMGELLVSQDGTWFIPPALRGEFPDYQKYVKGDGTDPVAGTIAVTLASNNPIPVFENGEAVGGMEAGDPHAYLVVRDHRTGENFEVHQSFIEDSNDPSNRPAILGFDQKELAKKGLTEEQAMKILKDPETPRDGVAMLVGDNIRVPVYACEIISNYDDAGNWNAGVKGSNFNYVPLAAAEYTVNARQLALTKLDTALASRECAFVPDASSPTKDPNADGFVPQLRDSKYPDGTPRHILQTKEMVDGQEETGFIDVSPDATGKLPDGAIRAREYVTRVDPQDMQFVRPYNHHTSNCLSTAFDLADSVGIGSVRDMLAIQRDRVFHTYKQLMGVAEGSQMPEAQKLATANISAHGQKGEVDIYKVGEATLYDFGGMKQAELSDGDITFKGFAGKMIDDIADQRREAFANSERPEKMTILPYNTTGALLAQCQSQVYGTAPALGRQAASALNVSRKL